jgi:WD40 repeat protein
MLWKQRIFIVLGIVVLVALGAIGITNLRRDLPWDQPRKDGIPEDRAELDIDVPPGTVLTMGGQQLQEPRHIFTQLDKGKWREETISAVFKDGPGTTCKLLVQGGWKIRLALRPPGPPVQVEMAEKPPGLEYVVFGRGGGDIVSASRNMAAVWRAEAGAQERTFISDLIAISPDGNVILTGRRDDLQKAYLWRASIGTKIMTLRLGGRFDEAGKVHQTTFGNTAVGPEGKMVFSQQSRNTSVVWDESGKIIRTFENANWAVFSLSGTRVLVGIRAPFEPGVDPGVGTVVLSSLETTGKEKSFRGDSGAISLDGNRVATPQGKDAIIWDANTSEQLHTLKGHKDFVRALAFGSLDLALLTGSNDQTAILWDTATGQRLRTLTGHTAPVTTVAFAPVDHLALTGSEDGTTRLWDIATGTELARLWSFPNGKDWLVATPEGLFDGSENARKAVSLRIGTEAKTGDAIKEYHRPTLLGALFGGERPMPTPTPK